MKRIFLVGLPRSGTTLLQSMLFAGGEIYSMPETHLFRLGLGRKRLKSQLRALYFRYNYSSSVLGGIKLALSKKSYIIEVFKRLDEDCKNINLDCWLEKTPEHLYYASKVKSQFPCSKFIFIRRNAVDVAASIIDMWCKVIDGKNKFTLFIHYISNLRFFIRYAHQPRFYNLIVKSPWIFRAVSEIKSGIEYFNKNRPLFSVVDYEALIKQPKETLQCLCNELDIAYNDLMLKYEEAAKSVINANEVWKSNNSKSIDHKRSSKILSLSSLERDFIYYSLKDERVG